MLDTLSAPVCAQLCRAHGARERKYIKKGGKRLGGAGRLTNIVAPYVPRAPSARNSSPYRPRFKTGLGFELHDKLRFSLISTLSPFWDGGGRACRLFRGGWGTGG